MRRLERFFRVREAGSTVRREALAGLTTFLAMSYILFVNPAVLSQAGMDFGAVFTATCLASAAATLIMGWAANYPIALAPGMGQNFFFLTIVLSGAATWQEALGAVMLAGALFTALTLTRVRGKIIEAIPEPLMIGIAAGIGLFIALLGLVNAGVVRGAPGRLLQIGDLSSSSPLLAFGALAVTVALAARRVRGALLLGMSAAAAAALALGLIRFQGLAGPPPSLAPTFLQLDLAGILRWEMAPLVAVFLYMAMFDAIGTLVAVGQRAGLVQNGRLVRGEKALLSDAAGSMIGAALGTSTVTAYIESATGVEEGGRTGLANVVTAALFLLALPAAPLARMVGGGVASAEGPPLHPITAPALLLVGAMMARGAARIPWDDPTEAVPAFLVMAGIPFTFSIADGLALGFIAYPVMKLLAGRAGEVSWIGWLLAGLFAARYGLP
ncbi:MAG TPA: NCS2 family permease [Candidatus Polarisedimenticolia bacterium]|nr:NCS2 family permease [Candidatus Polarisedimenticolia bacterium]